MRVSGIGHPRLFVLHNERLYKYRPFARFVHRKENLTSIELNNWGFHDYHREARNDKYRIFFFGDSFLEGLQVSTDSLFTSLLQEKFEQDGSSVEIINCGFSGTGTAYQYLLWQEFFRKKVAIDHIVVCIYVDNDLNDNSVLFDSPYANYTVTLDSMGNIFVRKKIYSLFQLIARNLTNHSALAYFVYNRLHILKARYLRRTGRTYRADQNKRQEGAVAAKDILRSAWNNSINGTIRLIERWHKELSSENIGLSIVVIKGGDFFIRGYYQNEYIPTFLAKLRKRCAKNKIQILELSFEGYDPHDTYFSNGIGLGHFNHLGHRISANQIFSWLKGFMQIEINKASGREQQDSRT